MHILRPLSPLPSLFLLKVVYLVTSRFEPTVSPILLVTVLAEWNCNILNIFFSVGHFINVGILTSFLFYFDLEFRF